MYSVKNQNDDEVDQSFGEAIVGLRARGASWPQLTTFTNDKVTMMMMMTMTMMMAMVMMVNGDGGDHHHLCDHHHHRRPLSRLNSDELGDFKNSVSSILMHLCIICKASPTPC